MKKTMTINGKRYTVSNRSYDDNIDIKGPRVWTTISGVAIDSPNLRERVITAIEEQLVCNAKASAYLQENIKSILGGK